GEIRDIVMKEFTNAKITFHPDDKRQAIVDSWPEDVDDSAARRDWGFNPEHDLDRAFNKYLIPGIRKRYAR
ncbi:MAG: putative L-threonine dehydrogenase, partial [Bacteroidetes bacterium]|nr:putative L-threonine dehydrogenase [Bacteroidota bacterium]